MKLLISFLRKNIYVLLASFLALAAYTAVMWLYGGEMWLMSYAIVLAVGLCAIVACARLFFYASRSEEVRNVANRKGSDVSGLPKPIDAIESDYQEIINRLSRELIQTRSEHAADIKDMSDYYTLWAHQIKTPIAAMRLLIKPTDDKLLQELFKIEQYVDMALNIARMQSDASDYVIKKQPLDPIVRKAIRKYARLIIGKKLTVEYTGCDVSVNTDEKWLGFAIEQILSNAVKYTRRGGIRITADGGALNISDTGIGIAPECLPRIFDKGFTGYAGRADEKSSGLGLYMAKTALGRLGHGIDVNSVPDNGTSVRIVFNNDKKIYE